MSKRFTGKRIVRAYRQTINAQPDRVFELLCPVREADWFPGWEYSLVYSESGLAEPDCTFLSHHPGEPDTIWIITRHEPENRLIEFARITPGLKAARLMIRVEPETPSRSRVEIAYTMTGLGPEGNEALIELTQERFEEGMRFWESSMNEYLIRQA